MKAVLDQRPVVRCCTIHRIATRKRAWSLRTYRKAMTIRDRLHRVEADDCPYCLLTAKLVLTLQLATGERLWPSRASITAAVPTSTLAG